MDTREAEGRPDRRGDRQEPHRVRRSSSTSAASMGLLHITDMSGARHAPCPELFQVGDHVRVKVLKFNAETERVSLGLKQISEDPWTHAQEKYPPGTVVRGKVVSLKDYGAFIELEQGIGGLVHISEMSWTRRVKHPVEASSPSATPSRRSCWISTRARTVSAWASSSSKAEPVCVAERVSTRRAPSSKASSGTSPTSASFVEIEDGIDGLVHVSDLSWTQRVKHPSELYQDRDDEVEAVVLNIDFDGEKAQGVVGYQAAGSRSVGPHPVRLPDRQDRRSQGHQGVGLRRVRGDRAGRRGSRSMGPSSPRTASKTRRRS